MIFRDLESRVLFEDNEIFYERTVCKNSQAYDRWLPEIINNP